MADFSVEQQRLLADYKAAHEMECTGLSDAQILSIMAENEHIRLTEAQKQSLFLKNTTEYDTTGLVIEHQNDKKEERKNVKTEQVTNPYLAKLQEQEEKLKKVQNEQGFIGKGWDWFKNRTGIGDGSSKALEQINNERELLQQALLQNLTEEFKQKFKEITGEDFSEENLEKFKKGELSKVDEKINDYTEGQDMAADVAGDIISGIAAVGIYTVAVAAAPFTGGLSIAAGVAAATVSGAAIKSGVKALDTVGTERKYTSFGHDCATGAFSGLLAPITGGLGGAAGKAVATRFGVQAVKQVGKEVAEEVAETGTKQGLKIALTNPTGYEYVGGKFIKRAVATGAEMATDGALGGAVDGGFRAGLDNEWDAGAMASGFVEGGIGGAIMAPLIGGGMKAAGKGAQKVFGKHNVRINVQNKRVRDDIIYDFIDGKIDENYAAAVLRDVDDFESAILVAEKHIKEKDKPKLEIAKKKLQDKINKNIKAHGSIVLQSEIPSSSFTVDPKSGVRYAKASQNDMFLVHAVPEGKEVESISYLIHATRNPEEDVYASLSLANKNSALFGDQNGYLGYGIIPVSKSTNVTSAGFGQVSNYKKDFSTFVEHQSFENLPEENIYLRNSLLRNLKNKGYDLSEDDYVILFKKLKDKEYFSEITEDIKIGDKILKAEELRDALELSHIDLSQQFIYGDYSNNEVSSIIDGIRAIYARVDDIDDVSPEIKKLAKENGIDIILLGKPTKLDISANPEYQAELKSVTQSFYEHKITGLQYRDKKLALRNKYESAEKEKLRAKSHLEQDNVKIDADGKVLDDTPDVNTDENFTKSHLEQENVKADTDEVLINENPLYIQQKFAKKLENAKSDEDFIVIRDEIIGIKDVETRKNLYKKYKDAYLHYNTDCIPKSDSIGSYLHKYFLCERFKHRCKIKNFHNGFDEHLATTILSDSKYNNCKANLEKLYKNKEFNMIQLGIIEELNDYLKLYNKDYDYIFNSIVECNLSENKLMLLLRLPAEANSRINPEYFSSKNMKDLCSILPHCENLSDIQLLFLRKIIDLSSNNSLEDSKMSLNLTNKTLLILQSLPDELKNAMKQKGMNIDKLEADLISKLSSNHYISIKTDATRQQAFFKSVLANNKQTENLITNDDFVQNLQSYSATGIPLKYERKEFCSDLMQLISKLAPEDRSTVLNMLNINLGKNDFSGLLQVDKLNYKNFAEPSSTIVREIETIVNKFTKNNTVLVDDLNTNNILNDLISGFPEFTSVIGKNTQQGSTLDIQILQRLHDVMNNKDYQQLPDLSKTILKLAILLEDFGNVIEDTANGSHSKLSANFAKSILKKFGFGAEVNDRIINLIRYHHVLLEEPSNFNKYFRTKEDIEIAKILTDADLKSLTSNGIIINKNIYSPLGVENNPYMVTKCTPKYEDFTIHEKTVYGRKTKFRAECLDDYSDIDDVSRLGYPKGTLKKDVIVQLHSVKTIDDLRTVIMSSDDVNYDMILSNSIKTLSNPENGWGAISILFQTSKMNRGGGSYTSKSPEGNTFETFLNGYMNPAEIPNHNIPNDVKEYLVHYRYSPQFLQDKVIGDKQYSKEYLIKAWNILKNAITNGKGINELHYKDGIPTHIVVHNCPTEDLIPDAVIQISNNYQIPILYHK